MKQLYLKNIILAIFSFVSITASAYDCKVGGIYYNLNKAAKTANVTYLSNDRITNGNAYKGAITIPSSFNYIGTQYSVTGIGNDAFRNCSGLTSVVIPSSVTSIGNETFSGCDGLTSITIPSSVTSIGRCAFLSCVNMTSIDIPNSVTSIARGAFHNCQRLTSVIIPNSLTSLEDSVFYCCNNLATVVIPNSVTSIGNYSFYACTYLTSIVIPNSVTTIGKYAFYHCVYMTSIDIPNSVTSIGDYAFENCANLTSVIIPNSVTSIRDHVFSKCIHMKSVTIPSSVTSIGDYAFEGCSDLVSVIIPNSVTSIGDYAFEGCSDLVSVIIPNSVTSIGDYMFKDCRKLTSVTLGNSVTTIGKYAFSGCSRLKSIDIPSSVTSIGDYAFEECSSLTSIVIPNSVTTIGKYAFSYCRSLNIVKIGNNVTDIGFNVFYGSYGNPKFYVNKGTLSLLTIWNMHSTPYDIETGEIIPSPYISVISSTQTTITVTIVNYIDGYTYTINNEMIKKGEMKTYSGLQPGTSESFTLRVALDDISFNVNQHLHSLGLNMIINTTTTSSSISVVGSYTHGDAVVTSEEIYVDGKKVFDDIKGVICGLDPNTAYTINYYTNFGSVSKTVRTAPLTLTTSQPKVISAGNVIVAAESNLDDEETKVGFEWRRTDWTDDFASNKGTAFLYNGTMEGYIRNLYTEKLWKYRPYYTSNAGNTYYGEWVGIDPTNTSYFEPTVHTYANVSVNGNSAEVKGYVQRGTDNVVSKGFAYWEQSQGVKSREAMSAPSKISSLPSNAKTIEVSGSQQVMTASLSNLEYETTYCYVAFVRTSEGDTFYGEEMTFTSGESPYTLGDVNGDKQIDISDVVAMVNHILGNTSSTSFKPQAADINKDSNIDISDVVSLVNMILGQ